MKIGFVTDWTLTRSDLRSGVPFQIAKAMRVNGHEVIEILIPANRGRFLDKSISKIKQLFYNKLLKIRFGLFDSNYDYFKIKATTAIIEKVIQSNTFDILFSIKISDFALLSTNIPKVLWIDNTFDTFINTPYQPQIANKLQKSIIKNEKLALQKCNYIFTASRWLKNHLQDNNHIDSNKINVVERGASFIGFNSSVEFEKNLLSKSKELCHLLFINTHWLRKGGEKVIETCRIFNNLNFRYKLHIIGTTPPNNVLQDEKLNYEYYGKLYPHIELQAIKLKEIFEKVHFVFVPTLAEGFGIVFAEAASFGIPSIATDVMGVESSVVNGLTGQRFPLNCEAETYANYIVETFANNNLYNELALRSFDYYLEHFRWNKNVEKIINNILTVK